MTFGLPWSTRRSAFAGGFSLALLAPLVAPVSATPRSTFSDVSFSHWARPFIRVLAQNNILKGYADGTFRPDAPITRSQFESVLSRAFGADANEMLSGSEPMSRMQALVTLSNRLNLEPQGAINNTLKVYRDAVEIPSYAREGVAAATQKGLVVNYPNVRLLNPYQTLTRADAAAFVYQALVQQGHLSAISASTKTASYIVGRSHSAHQPIASRSQPEGHAQISVLVQGTQIPLEYPNARDVNLLITPGETYATTLAVADPVMNAEGEVLLPEGSRIQGRIVPIQVNGTMPATQFVADRLIIEDQTYRMNATSSPRIAVDQSELRSTDLSETVTSAAARCIVNSITGKSTNFGDFLSGTFGFNQPEPQGRRVIMVEPSGLTLTTQANLRLASL